MKSDERILELLSEYLHKTDRMLERMEKTDRNVEIMSKAILENSSKFNQINVDIKRLSEENNQMLKELISISKRVSNLEEKG